MGRRFPWGGRNNTPGDALGETLGRMVLVRRLGEQFWFLPAILCVAASAAALTLVAVDRASSQPLTPGWVDFLLYRVGSDGSRDLLGAIATSSLAVAGTTFSITMAVLALTSSTYGPRLVRNFMSDKANQTVLGVYVATFLYCLLVLRSVRVLGDPAGNDDIFVPHLAVNGAVLLAIANVGVLIFFIHHISDSVQVATLAGGVRRELLDTVERMYPAELGRPPDGAPVPDLASDGHAVSAGKAGYVQSVTQDVLLRAARHHDVLVQLRVGPGDYVLADTVMAVVRPEGSGGERLDRALRRAVQVADARTPHQDVGFAVQQLTEMAVRALSPGTNDPYTAQNAIDDLSAGLSMLASRPPPSPWRRDATGVVRVHAPVPDAVLIVGTSLDQLRWYGAGAPSVMHACVTLVDRVGAHAWRDDRSGSARLPMSLLHHLDLLTDAFSEAGHHPDDQARFTEHVEQARSQIRQEVRAIGAPTTRSSHG